jgi:hypothetical protein
MRARVALRILILASAAGLFARPAGAGPWGLAHGEWYSKVESGVFSSPSVYLDSGVKADTGLVVEQRTLSLYNELGWKKGMTFLFRIPAVSITRQDGFRATQATATGFQDLMVGMRWALLTGRVPTAFEVAWMAPMGYNRNLDSLNMRLGDGQQQLSLELHAGMEFLGRGFVQVSGGRVDRFLGTGGMVRALYPYVRATRVESDSVLRSRSGSERAVWSDRLSASADAAFWVSRSVLAGARYRGFVTLSHGQLAPDINLHQAGPVLLYRVDDRLDVYAGSWFSTAGRNTPRTNEVYAGIAFHKTKLNRLQGFLGGKQGP